MQRPYGWNENGSHRCTNSQPGTMGHECGKPAAWIGRKESGFEACFCEDCAKRGAEARAMSSWARVEQLPAPSLSDALADRGISHEPGKMAGRRRLTGPNGESLGEFDAKGAWAQLNGNGFAEELTAEGVQLVIPGCERAAPDNGKPAQLSLF